MLAGIQTILFGDGQQCLTHRAGEHLSRIPVGSHFFPLEFSPQCLVRALVRVLGGDTLQDFYGSCNMLKLLRGEPEFKFQELIRGHASADPHPCREAHAAPQKIRGSGTLFGPPASRSSCIRQVCNPEPFAGSDDTERTAELLNGEQAQRISREHADAAASPVPTGSLYCPSTTERQGKCCEAEIGFRLSTTGRKPEQVTDVPIIVRWIGNRWNIEQKKGELEGVPGSGRPVRPL